MAYTPPTGDNVDFRMVSGYTPPSGDAVYFEDAEPSGNSSLSDMAMDIQAFSSAVNNMKLDIVAACQDIETCAMDIHTIGEFVRDNMLDMALAYQVMSTMPVSISLAKEKVINAILDILLVNGIVTQGVAMDISVGDGNKIQSMGLDCMAVSTMPEFKSVYAMHLNSAIKEITS